MSSLLKSTATSKIYIVGRSASRFAQTLSKLKEINTSAELIFIEAQVSLLKEVDRVCATIKAQESAIDILWLSQGGMSLAGHQLTSEGLKSDLSIRYWSRILFMHQLMPLLNKSSDPRVLSILSAGVEGPINTTDIGLLDPKNFSFLPALRQGATIMSLAMKELSLENPKVSFIHVNPGIVSTEAYGKWADTMTGYLTPLGWLVKWILTPILSLFGWTPEDAGQVGLYEVTSERFGAKNGKNFYRLENHAEDENAQSGLLSNYEEDGTQKKVWEYTLGEFEKVLAQ